MTILSALVCLGQFLFSLGTSTKRYWLMHLGRVIFGIGGESLSVAVELILSSICSNNISANKNYSEVV